MNLKQLKKSILIVNCIFITFLLLYITALVFVIKNNLNTDLISKVGFSFIFIIPFSFIWGHWASNKIKELK